MPGAGMRRTAVVLLLTMPMAASSAMMADIVSALVSPGTAIMSSPTEQTQVMASSLSIVSAPERRGRDHALVLADGDERAGKPADVTRTAMTPPFFTASLRSASAAVVPCVPQTSSPISSRMRATRVADGGRRRERQVDDAEGHVEPAAGLLRDELPHARDAEGRFLDRLCHDVEGLPLARP